MSDKLSLISYTLAAMAGICFLSGLVILTDKGESLGWTDLRVFYP